MWPAGCGLEIPAPRTIIVSRVCSWTTLTYIMTVGFFIGGKMRRGG